MLQMANAGSSFYYRWYATRRMIPLIFAISLVYLVGCSDHKQPPMTPPSTDPRYEITDLGTLGGHSCFAHAINNQGEIVGSSAMSDKREAAFLWQQGKMVPLPFPPKAASCSALGMNNKHQIVGITIFASLREMAVLWHADRVEAIGTLGGTSSSAQAINNKGQVVGSSDTAEGLEHAFLWQPRVLTDLGTLGGKSSWALSINDTGQVVGASYTAEGFTRAFLWQHGAMEALDALPGGRESYAHSVNARGQVVGFANAMGRSGLHRHACLWQKGQSVDLHTLEGLESTAYSINNRGEIVGWIGSSMNHVAFIYSDGKMTDLNTLIPLRSGWKLDKATSINDAGQIVIEGRYNGRSRSCLLTPVP